MFELLLVFLLSHFTADFLLQTKRMIELKHTKMHQGLARHTATHLVITLIAVFVYILVSDNRDTSIIVLVVSAILITLFHYGMDWLKETMSKKYNQVITSASLFILDQILHVISILFVLDLLGLISFSFDQVKTDFLEFLFGNYIFSDPAKLLLILIIIILSTQGAGYFLGIVLRDLSTNPTLQKGTYNLTNEQTEIRTTVNEQGQKANEITTIKTEQFLKDSPQKIGRYIGMIERVLIMIFIVQGTPQGLTFLIAVKSLTRFKQFENKRFAEYYLIGSLLSALIAVVLGYAVVRII